MTHEEYMQQRTELLGQAQAALDSNDLEAAKGIKKSVEELDKKFSEIAEERANEQVLENRIDVPEITIQNTEMEDSNMEERIYNAASAEYKNAWLKEMARNAEGKYLIGEPTAEEKNAYTHTTGNTSAVVPQEIANRIIECVDSMAPLYADAKKSGMTKGFGVPRHTAIVAGDAAATNEGVANADEQDTFVLLPLDGVEIKKHVDITRKMEFQSIDAFEDWIVEHLAARIAVAKDTQIIAALNDATYGIAAANILTSQTYADSTIRAIFGAIKGNGAKVVYANGKTIWNELFGIQDGENRQLFIPSAMDDPLVQGRIYGALVKQDDNIPDDVVYVGIPKQILANDFDALSTARDMDIKTWVTTISVYSLFDAGLENPLSFVKASF